MHSQLIMKQPSIVSFSRQQRGAVLVVSMLMLLVVTILALGTSQSTRQQERMARNQRNYDLAFQAAEAGLRAGERMVDDDAMTIPPLPCSAISTPPCLVYERGYLDSRVPYEDQAFQEREWWTEVGQRYDVADDVIGGDEGLADADPQFYVEEIEEVPDSLTIPPTGPPPSRVYYRVIARGEGGTADVQAVLHSTYARRFN